ncbi:MAG: DUF4080 domain-containing protein [Burkholderiaceae bacterium]
MADIVLCTLNARYSHASLGLRSLLANLGDLRARARLLEFTLGTPLARMLEALAAERPRVIGIGVYIWNVEQTLVLVRALRERLPEARIVLGGPEISHETQTQLLTALADHVILGAGERAFARLAGQLLDGPRPLMKIIPGEDTDPTELALPNAFYDADDIAHRHLYLEASRGCPFKCAFCLSALDRSARPFDPTALADAIDDLLARGARRFRFVDRTFNLKVANCLSILNRFGDWMRAHPDEPLFLHFELIPDRLPQALREVIASFPVGVLQFEIGVQSFDPRVQAMMDRRQDDAATEANLRWLRRHTGAHLHVDLIAGLPGETLAGFGAGFDRLVAMNPHEIQVGLLKRLRGTPLAARAPSLGLVFETRAPYTIVSSPWLSAAEVARLARFARHWDLIGNSGRFRRSLPWLLGDAPFERFMALSETLAARLGRTHGVAYERWCELVHAHAATISALAAAAVREDYLASGASGRPAFLERGIAGRKAGVDRWRATLRDRQRTQLVHAPDERRDAEG